MAPGHSSEYDAAVAERCERVLVTLLGDIGPWGDRVVLVGGLAPRYIVGPDPLPVNPHVGTTDVDLVITLGDALELLRERFSSPDNDAPVAYANFLADRDDHEHNARLCNEAVAVVRQFLTGTGV